MTALVVASISVARDAHGRFCLNDLHKAAGGNKKHSPNRWARTESFKGLVKELAPEMALAPAAVLHGGANPGTYVCEELVFAYAMWISPSFHIRVIRAYKESLGMSERASLYAQRLAFENMKARSEQKGRIGSRLMNQRRTEKPAITKEGDAWKQRMDLPLFAGMELIGSMP